MTVKPTSDNSDFSALPSIDELLRSGSGTRLEADIGRQRITELARSVVNDLRHELHNGSARSGTKAQLLADAEVRLQALWERSLSTRLQRVINATGVVIHTNLGRAPLSDPAKKAIVEAADYCNVEYDITTGERGKRGARVEAMVCELTGAEDALIVNNCAAAAYLVLSVFASGQEVIISRGELVEIGGEFRVPDVLSRSGAKLREVGTTNRTNLGDYDKAISDKTSMILKVHPSNYRIVGFTSAPSLSKLSELAHAKNILIYEDAGSGAMSDLGSVGLADEPVISESIRSGVDIVTFSGDKLLGGPQAGVIAGRLEFIEKLRKDSLYRALRVGKLIYAGLEATLEAYLRGAAAGEVPVLKMLSTTSADLERRCRDAIENIRNAKLTSEVLQGKSAVGGGAAPTFQPESPLIVLKHTELSASALERKLRNRNIPVITRIIEDKVAIDLRTVPEADMHELIAALGDL